MTEQQQQNQQILYRITEGFQLGSEEETLTEWILKSSDHFNLYNEESKNTKGEVFWVSALYVWFMGFCWSVNDFFFFLNNISMKIESKYLETPTEIWQLMCLGIIASY